jgi:hypothetical protein
MSDLNQELNYHKPASFILSNSHLAAIGLFLRPFKQPIQKLDSPILLNLKPVTNWLEERPSVLDRNLILHRLNLYKAGLMEHFEWLPAAW